MEGTKMRVFIYETKNIPSRLEVIAKLISYYTIVNFFMFGSRLGFIVNDQVNFLPKLKVQIKNKFFIAIFEELHKIEPRKSEEIKIGHYKFTITSPNYLGTYSHTRNEFDVNVNYAGNLLTKQLYELCKNYLCMYS